MRHRRKTRYRWFPTAGTIINAGEETYGYSQYEPNFIGPQPSRGTPPSLNVDIAYFPLVRDETASELYGLTQGVSLRDLVEGQDWVAKRLVGSVFVAVGGVGVAGLDYWYNVEVTCGIAVARAKEANGELIDLDPVDYDPQAIDNSADSWMWRRSWVLSKPVQSGDRTPPGTWDAIWPTTNATGYGDIRSGTHIDVKSARRIRREERLWFIMKATGWDPGVAETTAGTNQQPPVSITADIRVLGTMRRGQTTKRL